MVGIGGVSMRILARACMRRGMTVTGSDRNPDAVRELYGTGIRAYAGSRPQTACLADAVVYTAAIADDDPELTACRAAGIPCYERKELLGWLCEQYAHTIAVAGTHGKTTVTAMILHIFRVAQIAYDGHVGGSPIGVAMSWGEDPQWFITEACEYHRTLCCLHPEIGMVLNCAFDHPDTYRDRQDLQDTFATFLSGCEHAIVGEHAADCAPQATRFGYGADCDSRATILCEHAGRYTWQWHYGADVYTVRMSVVGRHNVTNALAAATACARVGIVAEQIVQALESFAGVERRMQCLGMTAHGTRVITDYAHHPDEIAGAIDAARRMQTGELTVLFQPHTYSRTQALADEFAHCFYWADHLGILPTYAAREVPSDGMDARGLCARICSAGKNCLYLDSNEKATEFIRRTEQTTGLILVLGAGDIDRLAHLLVSEPAISTAPKS